jgi:hypothetical protein
MQQEPDSRSGRLMMVVVGVMGVLIVVGFAIVLVEVGRRMFTTKPAPTEPAASRPAPTAPARGFGQAEVRIPDGARVESIAASGDRVIAHVRTKDGASLGYVIDPATGALLGVIQFPAGGK